MRRHVPSDYSYEQRPHAQPHTFYNPRPAEPPIRHAEVHEYYDIPAEGSGGGGGRNHDWQLKHTIEQLRGDLDEKARQNQILHEKAEDMRIELIRFQDQTRAGESQRAREVSELHDQLSRERKTSNEHHTAACDAIRELQSHQGTDQMHSDKLREMSEHIDHINKNHELERRRWDQDTESMRRTHSRDMESTRTDIQTRLEAEHKSVLSRDDTVTKLGQQLRAAEDKLQLVVKELEAERVIATAEVAARKAETGRKEDLQKMFEKESGLKQKRVEEAHSLSRTLTNTLADKEKEIASLQSDLSHRQKLLDETAKSLKTAEGLSKEMTERSDKMATEYREIASLFGCRELLSSTFLASRHIREAIDQHEKTKHENTKLKTTQTEHKNTITSLQGAVTAITKERDGLKKIICIKDEQLTRTREDLLISTRELRALMIGNQHVLQDKLRAEKTIKGLEKAAKEVAKQMDKLEKAKCETAKVEIEAVQTWERERAMLEQQLCDLKGALDAKNDCEVQQMDKRHRKLEEKVREYNEWVDMCKELYEKVFKLGDVNQDPHCVNQLYRKVTSLENDYSQLQLDHAAIESDHARLERLQAAYKGNGGGGGGGGGCANCNRATADRVFDELDRNGDGVVTRREMRNFVDDAGGGGGGGIDGRLAVDKLVGAAAAAGGIGGIGGGGGGGGEKAEYLKSELRRSTQAMASAKRKFDDFKEAVAKALKFGKKARKVDTTTVMSRIHNLVTRAVAPLDGRFDDCLAHPCKSSVTARSRVRGGSSSKPCQTEPKLVKKIEHVQKKLLSALQTIEAQDMWISVLQQNADEDGGESVLSHENRELRGQLDSVRHHLLLETAVGELVDPTMGGGGGRTRRKAPAL